MGMWVRAFETCNRVAKIVAPKKLQLREAEDEYEAAEEILQKVLDESNAQNENLAGIQKELDHLTQQVELCQKKLERGETLIQSFGGEKTRWTHNEKNLWEICLVSLEFVQNLG